MALSRRTGQRLQASIWPGFVDAMTGLLLVLMFVLTIFMVVQSVLRQTISGQESELDSLQTEIAALADALGLEQRRADDLESELGGLKVTLGDAQERGREQDALIASLTATREAQEAALAEAATRITDFESQVAALLSERDVALGEVAALETARESLISEKEALDLALAQARSEIDDKVEAARLAAAEQDAMQALIESLRGRVAEGELKIAQLDDAVGQLEEQLSEEEQQRILRAAAAEELRKRLEDADAELTAMTLALEEQRRKAEETLTMLAAAEAARKDLDLKLAAALLEGDETTDDLAEMVLKLAAAEAVIAERNSEIAAVREGLEAALTDKEEIAAQLAAALSDGAASVQSLAALEENAASLRERLAAALAAKLAAEAKVRNAEDVERQLAAALAAKKAAEAGADGALSAAEQREALLATANKALMQEEARSAESMRKVEALNQQLAALRTQLGSLQALLDDYKDRDAVAKVQLEALGSDLNAALARAAAEERKRRLLEEAERARLEQEKADLEATALDLAQYRSEFFGRLRSVLGTQEGVRIVGDRFVFSSEVLFPPGGAELSVEGEADVAQVARILQSVLDEIPSEIDWIIRVDGHTDNTPIGGGVYADNWELSQARALSVVRFMIDALGLPPERLSANGFGEFQPVDGDDTSEARAKNRRIELKFTEK